MSIPAIITPREYTETLCSHYPGGYMGTAGTSAGQHIGKRNASLLCRGWCK